MSLANVVACSTAAQSIVLLGDPQQLAQPSKGAHPEGADVSALVHLLRVSLRHDAERDRPLPRTTHRMHPDVCRFISEVALRRPAAAELGLDRQRIKPVGVDGLGGAGLRFVPVEHAGNRTASTEEAMAVADSSSTRWSAGRGSTVSATSASSPRPTCWSSRRTTREVARIRQFVSARCPGRDGRQVPGPGGAGRDLLDGDVECRRRAERHGVPLRPAPPETSRCREREARRSSSAAPSCSGFSAAHRSRCASRVALCMFDECAEPGA